jgi:hypothetical protein
VTPESKAAEIVAAWPSKNYMDEAARPTIQKQIAQAIKEMMVLENIECAKAIECKDGFGPKSRQVAIETIRSRYDTEWEV